MNAGGVPNTCKSSGKVLHLVFDQISPRILFERKISRLEITVEC